MSALNPAVLQWLRTHRSTVSVGKLDELGVSRHQRARLVGAGVLEVVVRGAYRLAATEPDELQRCAALCAAHPGLVISGPTAARIWGIRGAPRDNLVHVTAPPGSHPCRAEWLVVSRCSVLPPEDIVTRPDGIRIISPPRAVVELGRHCDDDVVDSAVEWIGQGPVRFDLAIGSIKWVLEVDVHPSPRSLSGQARDHRRVRRSRRAGWWVEQVGELELTEAFEETMDEMAASANARREEVARLQAAGLWSA